MTENTISIPIPDVPTDPEIAVSATFIEPGTQLQTTFIGLEPAILVQAEYHEDDHEIELQTKVVGFTPPELVQLLEVLLDGAKTMAETDLARLAEIQSRDSEG